MGSGINCLDEFDWIASRPDEDLGEDFIVHIYYQGRATGVTFHVQLKSITNLHERRKGDFLVYDGIKVKDLKHWEGFSQPMVLVVWDIELREGRWALVEDVIAELDRQRPKWRENKTKARVQLPWDNTTDDTGLIKLKQAIGWQFYPLISRGRHPDIEIGLQFPDTTEGRTNQTDFINFLKRGGQFTLEGKFISDFSSSDWYEIWFGERDISKLNFALEFPIPSRTFPVAVTMITNNGKTIRIPNIELKVTEPSGLEAVTISNEHQDRPIHFRLTVPGAGEDVYVKINNLGYDVYTARNIASFLNALASGGKLRFTYLTINNASEEINVPPQPEKAFDLKYLELLDKLCLIENSIDQSIPILSQEFTRRDIKSIDKLARIIQAGQVSVPMRK